MENTIDLNNPAVRDRVEAVLRRATPGDQVAVYTFDRDAKALVSFDDWNRTAAGDRVAFATGRLASVKSVTIDPNRHRPD